MPVIGVSLLWWANQDVCPPYKASNDSALGRAVALADRSRSGSRLRSAHPIAFARLRLAARRPTSSAFLALVPSVASQRVVVAAQLAEHLRHLGMAHGLAGLVREQILLGDVCHVGGL